MEIIFQEQSIPQAKSNEQGEEKAENMYVITQQ
jgi:hypothetical protein